MVVPNKCLLGPQVRAGRDIDRRSQESTGLL